MRVVIVAGEASGDLYGAALAQALRALRPDVEVAGLGGPRMRRAGVDLLRDTSTWGAIGIVNALRIVPRALRAYGALCRFLRQRPPDVLVLIDFGAFNVRAGRFARRQGIPVYYFIAPGSWRRTGPVSPSLLDAADAFCTQFPWHAERLRAAGARAEFFGHPLLDVARPSDTPDVLRRTWEISSDTPVVSLFPGSRRHEIEHILPRFLGAAELVRAEVPDVRFVMGLAEVVDRRQVARILRVHGWVPIAVPGDAPWELVATALPAPAPTDGGPTRLLVATGRTGDCLSVAQAALCASGTVTLEAAILGVPQVIAYCGSVGMRLQYQFVKHRIRYIGLPNLLLDALVCPELRDVEVTPKSLATACVPLLRDGAAARVQREALAPLMKLLGEPGAISKAARSIARMGEDRGR